MFAVYVSYLIMVSQHVIAFVVLYAGVYFFLTRFK